MKLLRSLLIVSCLLFVGQANAQQTAQQPLQLSVQGTPLTITTTHLSNGITATAYSKPVAVSGGVAPYTFSISAGTLPAGLTISPSTGVISGTPTVPGTSSFTVRVVDAASTPATEAFTGVIVYSQLTFTTTTIPTATVNTAFTGVVAFAGGVAPYACSLMTGTLPTGLTLTTVGTSCTISGTPTQVGNFSITVRVSDASQLAMLRVEGVLYASR